MIREGRDLRWTANAVGLSQPDALGVMHQAELDERLRHPEGPTCGCGRPECPGQAQTGGPRT